MIVSVSVVTTLAVGVIILRLRQQLTGHMLARDDARAKQASHIGNPLRLGGVAVLCGMAGGVVLVSDPAARDLFSLLLVSVLPVFLTGLAEDMGYGMSPRRRLLAALVSALVASALLGVWVGRADLPGFDRVMAYLPVGIGVTVLFSAGYCHAVNLIDGMNGLAAITVILSAIGLSVMATEAGQGMIADFALLLALTVSAFLALNWPAARLFLGDAGAYSIGHLLTWAGVVLVAGTASVAVPAVLLVLFWPLADVFHTLLRRIMAGQAPFAPDRMHLHHKVRRALDMVFFGYNARALSNPVTTLVLAPFIALPVITGVLVHDRPGAAWIALALYFTAFALAHAGLPRLARFYRRAQPSDKHTH